MSALLEIKNLRVSHPLRGGFFRWRQMRGVREVRAVDDVSLRIGEGESLGLVGESGCGKSTLARAVVGLATPQAGDILWRGRNCQERDARRAVQREARMIFQDPHSSLNPRLRLIRQITEPMAVHGLGSAAQRKQAAADALAAVGMPDSTLARFPHQFSGGQKQRLVIARALVLPPALLVADEPVAALDVSVQAQTLNLFASLKRARKLALLFISHNLAAVNFLCERVAVMYLGRIVEVMPRSAKPAHPYTQALRAAIPAAGKKPQIISGEAPSAAAPPSGCRFHPRCPRATPRCAEETPPLAPFGGDGVHRVACHFPGEAP